MGSARSVWLNGVLDPVRVRFFHYYGSGTRTLPGKVSFLGFLEVFVRGLVRSRASAALCCTRDVSRARLVRDTVASRFSRRFCAGSRVSRSQRFK